MPATMLPKDSVFRPEELGWGVRYGPAEVRLLPGHSTAALLACRILPGEVTRFRTARMTTALWLGLPYDKYHLRSVAGHAHGCNFGRLCELSGCDLRRLHLSHRQRA